MQDFIYGLGLELNQKHKEAMTNLLLYNCEEILNPVKGQNKLNAMIIQEVIDTGCAPAVDKVLECCTGAHAPGFQ